LNPVHLQTQIASELREGESLKFHTGLRLGGSARWFVTPQGMEDLRHIISWAGKSQIPFRVIGNGTSLVVRPEGYDGLVIQLAHVLNHIRMEENRIYAGAGAMMSVLLRQAISQGLSGLEDWYCPMTVGGWLMRMGRADVADLDHLVKEMYVMEPDGSITRTIEPSQLFSRAPAEGTAPEVVVEVVFQLQPEEPEVMAGRIEAKEREWKFLTQTQLPLAGPVFLPTEDDLTERFVESGVSGMLAGKAAFLGMHGGYIANLGGATYDDVLTLMTEVKKQVLEKTGIHLQEGLCQL
jgi:UDP-N-acetylmuramate dehydrogenase